MRTNRSALLAVLLLSLVTAACASGGRQGAVNSELATILRVENHTTLDMTIYAMRSDQRVRLGTANALGSTTFQIPRHLVAGVGRLRFLADPIGSDRTELSEEVAFAPGDEIIMTIPPL
jgi:hypothetical protein